MKLINKYIELRDEIYNDLVNKIEISKKDRKVLDTTIAFQITEYRGTNKEISEITGISKSKVIFLSSLDKHATSLSLFCKLDSAFIS